ncbi:hypothetical protein CEXT_272941 [Caerostris extrusa]|uniref:Uncharacterized protein n=1 Tax=Caerostris extrusa TaxID=172846 RepID=A0AAV4U9D7_CAEEX|nr:hypothetical protein CEXT_272941 [Caerostris extrusa]
MYANGSLNKKNENLTAAFRVTLTTQLARTRQVESLRSGIHYSAVPSIYQKRSRLIHASHRTFPFTKSLVPNHSLIAFRMKKHNDLITSPNCTMTAFRFRAGQNDFVMRRKRTCCQFKNGDSSLIDRLPATGFA